MDTGGSCEDGMNLQSYPELTGRLYPEVDQPLDVGCPHPTWKAANAWARLPLAGAVLSGLTTQHS